MQGSLRVGVERGQKARCTRTLAVAVLRGVIAVAVATRCGACTRASGYQAPSPGGAAVGLVGRPGPSERVDFLGTEPFFAGSVDAGILTYVTPDAPEARTGHVARTEDRDAVRFIGELSGLPVELVLFVAPCSDGMSERRYPYRVEFALGGESMTGCAGSSRRPSTGERAP